LVGGGEVVGLGQEEGGFEVGTLGWGEIGEGKAQPEEGGEEECQGAAERWDHEMASFHLRFRTREHYTVLRL
jgi:hypothetical protein